MELKFIVYEHVNLFNNKRYIGITSQIPEVRWQRGGGYRENTIFFRAIKKYGWDNFEHNILYEGLSNREALEIESTLIKKYKSLGVSYNISDGYEELGISKRIPIIVYDTGGNYVGAYISIHKASIELGIPETNITMALSNKYNITQAKGYVFLKEGDNILDKLDKVNKRHSSARRPVIQLTKNGQILAEFNSVSDAANSLGCGTGSISNCLKGRYKTAAGYKWRYKV